MKVFDDRKTSEPANSSEIEKKGKLASNLCFRWTPKETNCLEV
jgi:hypothetical protein